MRLIGCILCAVILLPLPVSLQAEALQMTTESEYEHLWTDEDADHIAKVLYHECRSSSKTEQAAVVWVILNRADSDDPYYPDTIIGVVKQKNQFAYRSKTQVLDELREIAVDVLIRWEEEKYLSEEVEGVSVIDVGRVLPPDYLYFTGDGKCNYFRNSYAKPYTIWDWSLPSPYEND